MSLPNPSPVRPVACPRLAVPRELYQLHFWLITVERADERANPRSLPSEPVPGLSAAVINRYVNAAAHINAALKANGMLEEGES